jgi:hypothetical protein
MGESNTFDKTTLYNALDEIAKRHVSGKPSIVNLSIQTVSQVTPEEVVSDQKIRNLVDMGILVVVAAGNNTNNSCLYSPSQLGKSDGVIVVASSDSNDRPADDSNMGECVDVFAPGEDIRSAGIANQTESAVKSGTSMAAPHVSGLAALYLQKNRLAPPEQVERELIRFASRGKVQIDREPFGVQNRLAFLHPDATTSRVQVTLEPSRITLLPGGTQQFTATVKNATNSGVKWEYSGGVAQQGTTTIQITAPQNQGRYRLVARSIENEDALASATIDVVGVKDEQPPTVKLLVDKTEVTQEGKITLTATATDNQSILAVEFWDGQEKLTEVSRSPYTYNLSLDWKDNRTHEFYAKAYDPSQNVAISDKVPVKVDIKPPYVIKEVKILVQDDSGNQVSEPFIFDPGESVSMLAKAIASEGVFYNNIGWKVIRGPGSIRVSQESNQSATYFTLPSTVDSEVEIEATSLDDPNQRGHVLFQVINPAVTGIQIKANSFDNSNELPFNTEVKLVAEVLTKGKFKGSRDVVWGSIDPSKGTLNKTGGNTATYRPPGALSDPFTLPITATSVSEQSISATKNFMVVDPNQIRVSIATPQVSTLRFGETTELTAKVEGIGTFDPTSIWSLGTPNLGGLSLPLAISTRYTAGCTLAPNYVQTVTAASKQNPAKTAFVNLQVIRPQISVGPITPPLTSIDAGSSIKLGATVSGGVGCSLRLSWSKSHNGGVISPNSDGTITFEAPSLEEGGEDVTITITAASQWDSSKFARLHIKVIAPPDYPPCPYSGVQPNACPRP